MLNLTEHLLCPDCHGKIRDHGQLTCESCGRVFWSNGRFLNLLPMRLVEADLAEERFWESDRREGLKAHPLVSLMVKRDVVLRFYEQILPKLELKGRILEIGSGLCWLSSSVKSAFPATFVVATDVAPSALVKGSQISSFMSSSIDYFVACKAEQLPFESNFFDYIVGSAVLHHTCPRTAVTQIFRVLKDGGVYFGWGELTIPKILALIWGNFGIAARREKQLGVKEGNYSLPQWKDFFDEAGFNDVRFYFDKDPEYKQHWFTHFYYKLLSRIPDPLIRRCLASSLDITASK